MKLYKNIRNINYINNYFIANKKYYFENKSYDYQSFPCDIRPNSVLERYNKEIKNSLGDKNYINWIKFLNFIKSQNT